jgi:hypothetical protein
MAESSEPNHSCALASDRRAQATRKIRYEQDHPDHRRVQRLRPPTNRPSVCVLLVGLGPRGTSSNPPSVPRTSRIAMTAGCRYTPIANMARFTAPITSWGCSIRRPRSMPQDDRSVVRSGQFPCYWRPSPWRWSRCRGCRRRCCGPPGREAVQTKTGQAGQPVLKRNMNTAILDASALVEESPVAARLCQLAHPVPWGCRDLPEGHRESSKAKSCRDPTVVP